MARNNSRARKELRKERAKQRQEHWESLTFFEKVSKLEERGYGETGEAAIYREKVF